MRARASFIDPKVAANTGTSPDSLTYERAILSRDYYAREVDDTNDI